MVVQKSREGVADFRSSNVEDADNNGAVDEVVQTSSPHSAPNFHEEDADKKWDG